jgi:anti-sigma-K factor RskA
MTTAACHECRDLIGGYVLGALDPDETALVQRHIETCSACSREHAELATIPALLDMAESADAVPERPPLRLEEAVLDRFAREHRGGDAPTPPAGGVATGDDSLAPPPRGPRGTRRRRFTRPNFVRPAFGLAATAAVALIVAVVLGIGLLSGGDSDEANARVYHAQLASQTFVSASGKAELYAGTTGTKVHLSVDGLRPPAGHVYNYELWCVRSSDGWKISAGTFRVDSNGHADVRLTTAAKPTEYDQLSIQARAAGDSPDSAGMPVMGGRIQS